MNKEMLRRTYLIGLILILLISGCAEKEDNKGDILLDEDFELSKNNTIIMFDTSHNINLKMPYFDYNYGIYINPCRYVLGIIECDYKDIEIILPKNIPINITENNEMIKIYADMSEYTPIRRCYQNKTQIDVEQCEKNFGGSPNESGGKK